VNPSYTGTIHSFSEDTRAAQARLSAERPRPSDHSDKGDVVGQKRGLDEEGGDNSDGYGYAGSDGVEDDDGYEEGGDGDAGEQSPTEKKARHD